MSPAEVDCDSGRMSAGEYPLTLYVGPTRLLRLLSSRPRILESHGIDLDGSRNQLVTQLARVLRLHEQDATVEQSVERRYESPVREFLDHEQDVQPSPATIRWGLALAQALGIRGADLLYLLGAESKISPRDLRLPFAGFRVAHLADIPRIVDAEQRWPIGHDVDFIADLWRQGFEHGWILDNEDEPGRVDAHVRIAGLSAAGVAAIRTGEVINFAGFHHRRHFTATTPPPVGSVPSAAGAYITMVQRSSELAGMELGRALTSLIGNTHVPVFARPSTPGGYAVCSRHGRHIRNSEIYELLSSEPSP